jgi:two-component system CheB/CheR fusion protein
MQIATKPMRNQPPHGSLLTVVRDLSFARELPRVAEIVRKAARRLTDADGVTFILRDDEHCLYYDEDAIGPLWKGRRFPLERCISGWVMRNREAAVIPDIYADARVPHDAYRPTFVKSLAVVPVRKDDPIAAIGAYWADHHEATPDEVEVLQAVADAAALALENVHLYGDLQAAIARERSAREAAEESNRLKDEFLAILSHELRTPLNVIQGWLWQLEQPTATPEQRHRAVDVLSRNTALQIRLVEDLLDTSRAMAGKLHLHMRPLCITELCEKLAEQARPAAAAKGVRLTAVVSTTPLSVNGDPDRLHQVVSNLLANAVKFTEAGGEITMAVEAVSDNHLRISVADSGAGISPEFLPHVFDQFRQADSSSTRRHGGLGLGLTLVRQLVLLHGGTVRAESAGKGRGTTVVVELPTAGRDEWAAATGLAIKAAGF